MSSDGGRERPDHTSAGPSPASALTRACARISESMLFQWTVIAVILINAGILGLETYSGIERDHGTLLHDLDKACLAIVIAVVINSVEEARRIELEREAGRALAGPASEAPQLAERVADLREALDEFERQLTRIGATDGRRRPGARDPAGEDA